MILYSSIFPICFHQIMSQLFLGTYYRGGAGDYTHQCRPSTILAFTTCVLDLLKCAFEALCLPSRTFCEKWKSTKVSVCDEHERGQRSYGNRELHREHQRSKENPPSGNTLNSLHQTTNPQVLIDLDTFEKTESKDL